MFVVHRHLRELGCKVLSCQGTEEIKKRGMENISKTKINVCCLNKTKKSAVLKA